MPFAQLVLGSPGAGKSTYCDGMHQFLGAIGRACSVVNLDPANENANYPKAIDIRSIAKLEDIMARDRLGPNGGILYALEELEHNIDWLEEGLKELGDDYVIFDCPGQVELYTHHSSLRNIFLRLQKLGYRLVVVHLSDSFCLTQPSLYISNLLLSLRAMLQMDLPHINVLSKIDKVASYDPLPFNLDFYTDVQDVSYLMPYLEEESPVMRNDKFGRLNEAVANMIESYGLLVVVHLSDSFCLTQPSLYISNLLLSLRAMLQMDLPHINVLSKIDKVASYDPLPFNLDFYTDVQDVSYLMPYLEEESPVMRNDKFGRLNEAVANMIESYGLVRFEVLAVENKKSMMHLLRVIDRAGGYVFGTAEGANDTVWQVAMRNESSMLGVLDIQERWVDQKADYDRLEQEEELLREGAEQRSGEDLSSLHDSQGFQGSSVHDPDFGDMNVPANSGVKVVRKT
ncbi:hypothetical protein BN1708_000892 [Verticillium longisporum]|uniref:ATP-binding domain 1 family member B homolog n=2 Tax=Verticillium longisporum TaxID=100787 RepID=A0A0G4M8U5_VERLO|nr:hypothetical protein BN1708_000892 [Verticillium longisporum]